MESKSHWLGLAGKDLPINLPQNNRSQLTFVQAEHSGYIREGKIGIFVVH